MPHVHFHTHGGDRHAHDHDHGPSDQLPPAHAHSNLEDPPAEKMASPGNTKAGQENLPPLCVRTRGGDPAQGGRKSAGGQK